MKNLPGLHNGFSNDHRPTFHAISTPPGHIPISNKSATIKGCGSGNGMIFSTKVRMLAGMGAFRNIIVATLLVNK